MIDLSKYIEIDEPIKIKTVMTCYVSLDKKSMLKALEHEQLLINGVKYRVPELQLLECLINRKFGETRLDLEQIG
jgi:hypothetical protein